MNCFAHALPFLGDPYFVVGACLPDWLAACDRKCRVREKKARAYVETENPEFRSLARGIIQHHQDDAWFHASPVFNQLTLNFSVQLREVLFGDRTMRTGFLGHVLVELFLDGYLDRMNPGKLESMYQQIGLVDPVSIQNWINQFASKKTEKLVRYIQSFLNERYLFDYATDSGTLYRVNRVFHKIGLQEVGDEILEWMPAARQSVEDHAADIYPWLMQK
ncbi:MAG: hypothetical protein AAF939_15495 [Planctomycetota bacterium]